MWGYTRIDNVIMTLICWPNHKTMCTRHIIKLRYLVKSTTLLSQWIKTKSLRVFSMWNCVSWLLSINTFSFLGSWFLKLDIWKYVHLILIMKLRHLIWASTRHIFIIKAVKWLLISLNIVSWLYSFVAYQVVLLLKHFFEFFITHVLFSGTIIYLNVHFYFK